ncbi:hypothetical protein D3C84_940830 [compost metagenome]
MRDEAGIWPKDESPILAGCLGQGCGKSRETIARRTSELDIGEVGGFDEVRCVFPRRIDCRDNLARGLDHLLLPGRRPIVLTDRAQGVFSQLVVPNRLRIDFQAIRELQQAMQCFAVVHQWCGP